ncbi:MAG TPA: PAS domain S-box protein, partial [bacterium]|nr:PAS domain S-box protein [bacterium]
MDDVLLKAIGDIGEGILVVEGTRIVYANEAFQKMTGYAEEQLLTLSSFFNLLDDPHKEKYQEKIIAFRKNPKGVLRFPAILRADRVKSLSVEITLTVLKEDPQDRMVALVRDVSDQKRLQETVKDQELQYKLLFKNNPNPMFIYDLESLAILSVNDAAILKYGYTEKEFLGMTLKGLRREEDVPKLLHKLEGLKKGSSVLKETVLHRKKDGTLMEMEIISHSTLFEGRMARVLLAYDMTEHLQAENALRESQKRLSAIVTSAPLILFTIDPNGLLTLCEGSGLKALGLKPGELVGKSAFDLYRDNHPMISMLRKALDGQTINEVVEIGGIYFETRCSPLKDDEGKNRGVMGLAIDITETKKMENMLRQRERFEKLITSFSSKFINLAPEKVNDGISKALKSIGETIGVDRIFMFMAKTPEVVVPAFQWRAEGVEADPDGDKPFPLGQYPWFSKKLGHGEVIDLNSVEDLPAEAAAERRLIENRKVQSTVFVPMAYGGKMTGFLTFSTLKSRKSWTEEHLALLKMAGEMFANALERRRAEAALVESEQKFRELFNNANDAIFLYPLSDEAVPGKFQEVNDIACKKLGYSRAELLSMTPLDLLLPEGASEMPKIYKKSIRQEHITYEKVHVTKGGTRIPVEVNAHTFLRDGKRAVLSIARDVTDRKRAEETIRRQAYYDPLTNLPNRMLFKDRLEQAMSHAHRNKQSLGVIMLDLDRFKNINETLGHILGDRLLVAVAERLIHSMQEGETLARFGGDEFTLLLPQVNQVDEATQHAQKIIELLAEPFKIDGHELHLTTSMGIAFYPDDGENAEVLLKNAETAMYRAKEQGRNNFQLYASVMNVSAFKQLLMENSLRRALEKEEFVVHYQPQIDLASRRMVGVEALVRWQHPDLGLVFPTEFIGLAEETGLIMPIGEWVLRKVCQQNKKWQDSDLDKIPISVNLSA